MSNAERERNTAKHTKPAQQRVHRSIVTTWLFIMMRAVMKMIF